jgi:uncharacterized protein
MYERPFIDSIDFATNGRRMDAQAPFAQLLRLQDDLDNQQGSLHFILQGGLDSQGRPVLDIEIDGCCQLRCQRCLHGLDYVIQHESRLLLCDQAGLDVLEDGEEEYDGILADAHLDVLSLLEDEILLNLPIAPMHSVGSCQVAEKSTEQEVRHPFAALEKLKHK